MPWGLDLAAAWSWRLIVIATATFGLLWLLNYFAVVTVPLAIALLIAALANPFVNGCLRLGLPRGLSAAVVMVIGIVVVGSLLTFVGRQIAQGADDRAGNALEGPEWLTVYNGETGKEIDHANWIELGKVQDWLRNGPLGITDSQLGGWIKDLQQAISGGAGGESAVSRATEFGTALGHGVAGFFIALFATYFFMADGPRIWAWLVRLSPRAAREPINASGLVAWVSLSQFVKATVLVALADAIGVMIVATILGVPFVMAIGVLVFLGAFVPMIGATIAGSVAILVALVDQGPWVALLMLGGVIVVQQIEGHVLQPFLMGRFVSLHPLGVIVAIGGGVLMAGIVGALIAVPLAAAGNAVVNHLASLSEAAAVEAAEPDPSIAQEDDEDVSESVPRTEAGPGEIDE